MEKVLKLKKGKMNKKKYLLVFAFAVALAAGNMYVIKNNGCKVLLSLADLDSSANDPKEIDYFVPNKNNNPEPCTIYIELDAGVAVPEGAIHIGGKKYEIRGMENFCEKPEKGEDPTDVILIIVIKEFLL